MTTPKLLAEAELKAPDTPDKMLYDLYVVAALAQRGITVTPYAERIEAIANYIRDARLFHIAAQPEVAEVERRADDMAENLFNAMQALGYIGDGHAVSVTMMMRDAFRAALAGLRADADSIEITLHAGKVEPDGRQIASFFWPTAEFGDLTIPTKWLLSALRRGQQGGVG